MPEYLLEGDNKEFERSTRWRKWYFDFLCKELGMSNELSPESTLSRYRIVSKLGAGGMGEVYLAQDTKLNRRVALKILPAGVWGHQERIRRFEQEAKAASALNHPNIITIHEIDQTESVYFIAAEFIDGETLRQRMKTTPMKLGQIIEVAAQVANALSVAHAAGIIHRDIKPDNVMIRRDGIVKVLDFGLAKLSEPEAPANESIGSQVETRLQVTEAGVVMGTAIYMSPEQARGVLVDARTDIFSFGVLIYEMVVGRVPFDGSNTNEIVASILSDKEPAPMARYASDVPSELERIVAKALRKDRNERYQTIKDMLLDLQTLKQELEFDRKLERSAPPRALNVPDRGERSDGATRVESAGRSTVGESHASRSIEINKRNIAIAVAAILVISSVAGYFYFARERSGAIHSIAVMPFVNEGGNTDVEYLSDGMTETLIGSLSQLSNLHVKARSSVFRYKGKNTDAQTIGKELNVQAILLGRVVQHGEELTLNLELVDTQTENVIWSAQYKRRQTDHVSMQPEIARDVSAKLRQKFTDADEKRLEKRQTENTEAYQLYLQGRYQWNKRTKESLKLAVEYFQQAIEKDTTYALAYSSLADCYTVFSTYNLAPPTEAYTKARIAAQKALEIDPTLGEAYATLADVRESFDWDFAGSERDYQKALALAPNYATAHQWYGELLRKLGRADEALAEQRRAQELDPLSRVINSSLGITLYYARRYDEAIVQMRKVIETDANFATPYRVLGLCYTAKGMYAEAISEFQKAVAISNNGGDELAGLAYALAKSGNRSEALKILDQLNEQQKREYVDLSSLAKVYLALGEKEEAFAALEKAYQEKSSGLPYIKVNPVYDEEFRSNPRFQELLRKIGLP